MGIHGRAVGYEDLLKEKGVLDAMKERDRRIETLSTELEKAKQGELASQEKVETIKVQMGEAKAKAKDLMMQKMRQAEEEKEVLRNLLHQKDEELASLRDLERRTTQVVEIETLRAQLHDARQALDESRKTGESLKARLVSMEREIRLPGDIQDQCTSLESQVQELRNEKEALHLKIASLDTCIEEQTAKHICEAVEFERKILELDTEVHSLRDQLDRNFRVDEGKRESIREDDIVALRSTVESQRSLISSLEEELHSLHSEQEQLTDQQSRPLLPRESEAEEIVKFEEMVSDLRQEIASLTSSNAKLRAMCEMKSHFETLCKERENELETLKRRIGDETKRVSQVGAISPLTFDEDQQRSQGKCVDGAESSTVDLHALDERCEDGAREDSVVENLRKELAHQEQLREAAERKAANLDKVLQDRSLGHSDSDITELNGKIQELEGQVASRQAEILKVREKAKSYLWEINAENAKLKKKLEEEQASGLALSQEYEAKLQHALSIQTGVEKKAIQASEELEGSLGVIMECQTKISALEREIALERMKVDEANEKTLSIQSEFNSYKEKARMALSERDAAIAVSDSAVDRATRDLREKLMQAEAKVDELSALVPKLESEISSLTESLRAAQQEKESASSAAGLDRETTAAPLDLVRFELDDRITELEKELTSTMARASDAEARSASLTVKLEILEKRRKEAEGQLAATEEARKALAVEHNRKVADLEERLRKENASLKALRRTTTAVAMAFDPSGGSESGMTRVPSISSANSTGQSVRVNFHPEVSHEEITSLKNELSRLRESTLDSQKEKEMHMEQSALLKRELRELEGKYLAVQTLNQGTNYEYLKNMIIRYLETDDLDTMLPVFAAVLSFTPEEVRKIREKRPQPQAGSSMFRSFMMR